MPQGSNPSSPYIKGLLQLGSLSAFLTLNLRFPLHMANKKKNCNEEADAGPSETPHIHVLAVDDSLVDRKLIEKLLKTSSFKVTTAGSGAKALEILGAGNSSNSAAHCLQKFQFNLIITDYCMPGMSGYDLLKKVKESSTLREIPVIIMSSENVPSRIRRCLADGAEEFILKPVQMDDVKRLREHVRPVPEGGL